MPIDLPHGTFRNARWAGWKLTAPGIGYLILPTALATRLEYGGHALYWRFMSRQLNLIGFSCDPTNAWRAFAD